MLLLLGAAVVVAGGGCQALGVDRFPGSYECEDVESTMCTRLIAEVTAEGGRNISAVAVRCATGPCDGASGEVTITVAFADGATVVRNIGWDRAGLPIGFPAVPTCEGIKVDACIGQAARSFRVDEADRIVALHIRCEEGRCGPDEGTGESRLTFRDGTVREEGFGYALAPEPAVGAPSTAP